MNRTEQTAAQSASNNETDAMTEIETNRKRERAGRKIRIPSDFCTVSECAEVLEIPTKFLRRAVREGNVPGCRVGRTVLLDPECVREWLEQRVRTRTVGGSWPHH